MRRAMPMPSDARRALLTRLIDHAPLFPPAALPLAEALAEDARATASRNAFVLARFVCPASRLAELPDGPRGVSAVLDGPLPSDAVVESVEVRFPDDPDELGPLAELAPEVYVEVPVGEALDERLDALAALGLRAKVRCGGSETPGIGELAAFVRSCCARHLVFKATAGLHHALRREDEHGVLNLLAAAVFGDEERTLAEVDAGAFSVDASSFSWRSRSAPASEVGRCRHELLHSIGSCSFFEPVEELEAMGALPL